MRFARTSALLVTAGLLVSLAACATTTDGTVVSDPDCTPTPSGAVSESVKVTGDFAALPVVIFDAGIDAETTERSVIIQGDGDTVHEGDTVNVQFSILNGATAVNINGTSYAEGEEAAFPIDSTLLPGLVKTMECSTVGSRVVGVIPPSEAFGETGSTQLGIGATDDIVFVVDIISIEAPLVPAEWKDDVPTVTYAEDGTPTVTLPDAAPPTELVAKVLEEGDGAVVTSGQTVTLDYQGTSWEDNTMFDQSYGKEPLTRPTSIYVPGFAAALVGQKIGTTLLVGIPAEYGYGTAETSNGLGGKTLVFLIHIIS